MGSVEEDNPDWLRDYSDPSTMPGVGELASGKINSSIKILDGMMCSKSIADPRSYVKPI